MSKGVRRTLKTISTILVALIVILAMLLVGVRLFNMQIYTVLSGSMEPTYHTGSLLYVKEVDPLELENGDVITFYLSEDTIVTHRIVDVISAEDGSGDIYFQTKGDANNVVDGGLVYYKNVIGEPVFSIPGMGYMVNFIQHPPGIYIAIVVCVGLVFAVFLMDMLLKEDEKAKKSEHKNSENKNKEKIEENREEEGVSDET